MISVRPRAIALLFLSVLNGYSIKAMTKFQEKRDPNLKIKMSFAFLISSRAPPTLRLPSKNGNRAELRSSRKSPTLMLPQKLDEEIKIQVLPEEQSWQTRDWKVQISEQELKNLLIDQRILNNWFEMMMIKKDPCHLPFYEIRSRKCRYVCSTF